jgi:hypothetical protein
MLAVQTAKLNLDVSNVLQDPVVIEALRKLIAQRLQDESVQARLRPSVVTFTGIRASIALHAEGDIHVRGGRISEGTRALREELRAWFPDMVKAAVPAATQNLVLQAVREAGVQLGPSTIAGNGARVVQFSLF